MNDDLATLKTRFEPKEGKVLKLDRQLNAARFTHCGRFLLAAAHDGSVRRFDATSDDFSELKPIGGHQGWVQRLALSSRPVESTRDDVVYSVDSWGQLRCSCYSDDAAAPRWANPAAHNGWIQDLALSPSGDLLATCGIDRRVRVWATSEGSRKFDFENPDWEVLSVQFCPDETGIVAGDLSGKIRQWDFATGKVIREFNADELHKSDRLQEVGGVRRVAFTPDGKRLIAAGTRPKGGGNVQGIPCLMVFDWESGQLCKTVELGKDGDVYVTDLMFHPEGFLIVTISGNPGAGKLLFRRLDDDASFFETTKMANCHSVAFLPQRQMLAVVATNAGSNGNGRNLDKEGKYPGNFSPIHIWRFPATS